jgi:hypothetical protein
MKGWLLRALPAVVILGVVQVAHEPAWSWANGHRTPEGLLRRSLERCRALRDYSCTFTKQERLRGELSTRQTMRVHFREQPLSVYMEWLENADRIRRALYVRGRHRDGAGREQVVVEPAGALARLVAGNVKVALDGKEAREASRRSIDDFGFRYAIESILRENERFQAEGVLRWEPVREGSVDGRETWVLIRHLPYDGVGKAYPNGMLVIHIDREWLLPVALQAYADHAEQHLLEEYVFTDITLNPGLSEDSFQL